MISTPADGSQRLGLAAVGLCLFAIFGIQFDSFLGAANLTAISLNSSAVLIAAIGTMALLVSGNVDLSIGSQYALISVVTATVVQGTGDPWLGVACALSLGLLLGLINGWLVLVLNISPLIVTLAMLAIYRGLAFVAGGGVSVFELPGSFTAIGRAHWLGLPLQAIIAGLVYLIGAWVLVATVTGLRLFAMGGNPVSATLVGVPVKRLVLGTFATNGALIGLVALLGTAKLGSGSPLVGVQFEFTVLTAVILGGVAFTGGRGHPLGVLVGVVTLGVLNAGLIFAGLADWYQQIALGSLLLLGLAADQFLLGREQRRVKQGEPRPVLPPHPAEANPRSPAGTKRSEVVLEATDLTVNFAGGDALDAVSLRVSAGEVVCLVGDNGAGKSTLVKAICGAVQLATGLVTMDGQKLAPHPAMARRAGIETVFQDLALCPNLSVADNLALGLEPKRLLAHILPVRDIRAAERTARARLDALGVTLDDLRRPVRLLSGGERQIVQILRVMRADVRLVILDEPTAALSLGHAAEVLRLARAIAAAGHPVLLITHDVEEVFDVADRVVVLQRGRVIFDGPAASVSRLELLRLMSGRSRVEATRIMAAVSTERKRIERDLHDGVQQQLVNAALILQLATDQLHGSPHEHITRLLSTSVEKLHAASAEMRDLSRGIYPVLLSEYGLVPAVESLIRRNTLPIDLDAGGVPRVGEQVEITAYFVVAEALTNVAKHAHAASVTIAISHDGEQLHVTVADDGIGSADESAGTGLKGLHDRVRAVGGQLTITSPAGGGTTLAACVPAAESTT